MPERDKGFIARNVEKAKEYAPSAFLFALAIGTASASLGIAALIAIGGYATLPKQKA